MCKCADVQIQRLLAANTNHHCILAHWHITYAVLLQGTLLHHPATRIIDTLVNNESLLINLFDF